MLEISLELFGGRGGGSGGGGGAGYVKGSSDGALVKAKKQIIEGTFREARGWGGSYHKEEVLEATTDGKGNLTFSYAQPVTRTKTSQTNRTQHLTYEVAHGALDGKTFGINWSKVNSISGQTYNLRAEAKANGLSWDGVNKRWRRK